MKLKDEETFVQAQLVHERIADIAIDLYAAACTLARLDAILSKAQSNGVPAPADKFADPKAGRAFLKMAFRRVRANFAGLDENDDQAWLDAATATLAKW